MPEQYTYWSITINNPDENDMLIIRNPNDKYIRQCVWTPEQGEDGTDHIQAWVRLQRNQTFSFVKKLYPRAHIRNCQKDEYNENTQQYAQKNDETTQGMHTISINDPLPANDTLLYQVVYQAFERIPDIEKKVIDYYMDHHDDHHMKPVHPRVFYVERQLQFKDMYFDAIERQMILEKARLEKVFISPVYEKMKSKYWKEILLRLIIEENARITDQAQVETWEEGTESEGLQDNHSEADEDESEGTDSCTSEETY